MLCFQCKDVCSSHADMCSYVSTDQLTIGVKSLRNYNIQRDKLRENATDMRENGLKERVSEKRGKMSWRGQNLFSFLRCHWPHVDEILSEGDGLAVSTDGDCPVQIGRGVPVLAVRDTDHRSTDLPDAEKLLQICFRFTAEKWQLLRHYWSMFVPNPVDMSVTNHSNVHGCRR